MCLFSPESSALPRELLTNSVCGTDTLVAAGEEEECRRLPRFRRVCTAVKDWVRGRREVGTAPTFESGEGTSVTSCLARGADDLGKERERPLDG